MEILERRPYAYRTSFPLDEARVRLPDGRETVVLVKELDRGQLDDRTRRAKPSFDHDPRREIVVYEHVLAGRELGTPRCYGTIAAAEEGRYVIFLEKVAAVQLWQFGEIEAWERAARWAGRLHATVAAKPGPPLLRYDGDYFRRWMERARSYHADPRLELLAPAHERAVERLTRLPAVFVHGEFYASNILLAPDRVCPLDWEMAGLGPGVLDLAALATAWDDTDAGRLVNAYTEEAGAPVEDADLASAGLVLAVQWLGWAESWTPPREHSTDWLAEATDAAGRLTP